MTYPPPCSPPPSAPRIQPPLSVRAQQVVLWIAAALLWIVALRNFLVGGAGAYGFGYALLPALAGAFTAVLAVHMARGRNWVRACVLTLHILFLLIYLSQLPLGIFGLACSITGLVLILRRSTREFFHAAQQPYAPPPPPAAYGHGQAYGHEHGHWQVPPPPPWGRHPHHPQQPPPHGPAPCPPPHPGRPPHGQSPPGRWPQP